MDLLTDEHKDLLEELGDTLKADLESGAYTYYTKAGVAVKIFITSKEIA